MTQTVYQGFYDDLAAGEANSAADVRARLLMSNTTVAAEEDAQTISDFTTLDECDGVGYVELTIANLDVAYDAATDLYVIDGDDGDFEGGLGEILASTRPVSRILIYRYVDGTDAADVPWFSQDIGPFYTVGGKFDVMWNSTGIAYIGSA
jgi:hypothetical protein